MDYRCSVCGYVMEEEPDYEFSGKDEGNIAVFCRACVEAGFAAAWIHKEMVPSGEA